MLHFMYYTFNFNLLGRHELLTEHALAWNRRKVIGMANTLSKRYVRVSRQQNLCDYVKYFM